MRSPFWSDQKRGSSAAGGAPTPASSVRAAAWPCSTAVIHCPTRPGGPVPARVGPAGERAGGDHAVQPDHAQRGVAEHAVGEVGRRAGQPLDVRLLARGHHDDVRGHLLAAVQQQPPAVPPPLGLRDPATEPQLDAGGPVLVGDQRADRLADRARHQVRLGVDQDGLPRQRGDRAGDLAAGQPAADDGDPPGGAQRGPQRPRLGQVVQQVQAGLPGRPVRRQRRPGAGGDHQPVVRHAAAGLEHDPARVRVQPGDPDAGPPPDVRTAAQVQRGVLGPPVAVQQALRAGRPVVRADRLGAQHDQLAGEAEPAQLAGRRPAGRAGADDDDPVARSVRGRGARHPQARRSLARRALPPAHRCPPDRPPPTPRSGRRWCRPVSSSSDGGFHCGPARAGRGPAGPSRRHPRGRRGRRRPVRPQRRRALDRRGGLHRRRGQPPPRRAPARSARSPPRSAAGRA